jgi:pSer/pThr/pTyr-binding forkhead associated (FHA) protein
VSRSHCLIELAADQLRVTDLNSTNGTYIDNKRIDRSAILDLGSILRVGNVSFEHEVRPRRDMPVPDDLAGFDRRDRAREARIARSS